ncbi:hypothetical protein [Mycolicibacterium sp. XJ870]
MTDIRAIGLLVPTARSTSPEEVGSAPDWRAVCELPGRSPAQMATQVGQAVLAAAEVPASGIGWVIHCGSCYQGSAGWPVHHEIQYGVIGSHGNAIEIRQHCSGGLTSWLVGDRIAGKPGAVICTGADNWSWADRFATSRSDGGEPFSDAAHAVVLSAGEGFARVLGTGTASCPEQAQDWKTREWYWEHATMADFQTTFARVAGTRTEGAGRDSFEMLSRAVMAALLDAKLSAQYVTHFVPHSSYSGEPYRAVAKALGLPWSDALHQNNLDHGYLGVSTQVAGLIALAESESLPADSIVILLAAEYQLSATAVVLHIVRRPVVSAEGLIRTIRG